ncbi:MAG: hypothetical protein KF753_03770 [Caldilineaceae bacterium]|nr:hypothetical protein [Caldilineaceae bacterium]
MNAQWDIEIYDRDMQLVLAVEVKSKTDASPEWAAQLRRNILAHGIYPNPPYFLMAFPDQFFLWTKAAAKLQNEKPDYVVDARPILRSYLRQVPTDLERLSGQSLELIVSSWLSQIIYQDKTAILLTESDGWLVESGLLDAISGGRLVLAHEVVAA